MQYIFSSEICSISCSRVTYSAAESAVGIASSFGATEITVNILHIMELVVRRKCRGYANHGCGCLLSPNCKKSCEV